jgi:hypothetical protein
MVSDITKRWYVTMDFSGITSMLDSHSLYIYKYFVICIRLFYYSTRINF